MARKWLALLLVLALCLGMAACGKKKVKSMENCNHDWRKATCTSPAECRDCGAVKGVALDHEYERNSEGKNVCKHCGYVEGSGSNLNNPTTPTTPGNPTTPANPGNPTTPTTPGNPTQSYRGKTLQIYGLGSEYSYDHDNWDGKGSYLWMERAAIEEWAAINGATIEWMGSYNQSTILDSIESGNKPDIVFHVNMFPANADNGMLAAFTGAEYNQLAAICGNEWLDLMTHNNQKLGVVRPWTGTMMCYYNKTMFEDYGVKTPMEYFNEGNWNWDTFLYCMQEMTKDIDGDRVTDTYGLPGDSWGNLVNPWATDSQGRLISTLDEPWMQDYLQLKYDAFRVYKCSRSGTNKIQSNVVYPMFAMQISDCDPFNFEHMYQSIPNGNELEVVPVPQWVGDNREVLKTAKMTQSCFSMLSSCDEREAAVDCMAYLLKCGMKSLSDYSMGAITTTYEGIQGACEYSSTWKSLFERVCQDRAQAYQQVLRYVPYLPEHMAAVQQYLSGCEKYISGTYTGVTILTAYSEITQMPALSATTAIRERYQLQLDTYNNTYIR